ncbi:protein serine/threonine kinase, putative [Entamoeba invadens IP1]|uniref:Protein serine/threonine kinase, putative n=1 Tax=Entamoeba invadens IP1 TaxID=370355 RepID=A0A0A1TU43_ENTIV|nr:protein serine/threonine kinase, putative [Entamoeba invadens IP1]ELP83452.1 protein serine/threonine kinase, putative [Entamoeba invadens IP1]|eukprot:XP_004182798.1 protein serine/threonine kinase, putative [Entamoeba invadens IP1]
MNLHIWVSFIFVISMIYKSNAEIKCLPKTTQCTDGFSVFGNLNGDPQYCSTLIINYDFSISKKCLDIFLVIPKIEISAQRLNVTIVDNIFESITDVTIDELTQITLKGFLDISNIERLNVGKLVKIVLDGSTTFNKSFVIPASCVLQVDGILTLESSQLWISFLSTFYTSKLILNGNSLADFWAIRPQGFNKNGTFDIEVFGSSALRFYQSVFAPNGYSLFQTIQLHDESIANIDSSEVFSNFVLFDSSEIIVSAEPYYVGEIGGVCEFHNTSKFIVKNVATVDSEMIFHDQSVLEINQLEMVESIEFSGVTFKNDSEVRFVNKDVTMNTNYFLVTSSFSFEDNSKVIFFNARVNFSGDLSLIGESEFRVSNSKVKGQSKLIFYDTSKLLSDDSATINMNLIHFYNSSSYIVGSGGYSSTTPMLIFSGHSTLSIANGGQLLCAFDVLTEGFPGEVVFEDFTSVYLEKAYVNIPFSHVYIKDKTVVTMSQSQFLVYGKLHINDSVEVTLNTMSSFTIDPSEKHSIDNKCKDLIEYTEECNALIIKGNVKFFTDNTVNKSTPLLFVTNGGAVIEKGVQFFQTNNVCIDVMSHENKIYNKLDVLSNEGYYSLSSGRLLRYCKEQYEAEVYCSVYFKNVYDSEAFKQTYCPCYSTETEKCYTISHYFEILFLDNKVSTQFETYVSIIFKNETSEKQHIEGKLYYVVLWSGLSVLMNDKSVIERDGYTVSVNCSSDNNFEPKNIIQVDNNIVTFCSKENNVISLHCQLNTFNVQTIQITFDMLVIAKNGYYVNGDKSTLCNYGILTSQSHKCLRIKSIECGKYFYPSKDFTTCLAGPKNCTRPINSERCSMCDDGFILVDGICIENNDESCVHTTHNHCVNCLDNGISRMNCSSEHTPSNCVDYFNDRCFICDINNHYILQNGTCMLAEESKRVSTTSILECLDGFYLNDGVCHKCTENVVKCTNSAILQCDDFYYLTSNKTCESSHCIDKNSTNNNCLECDENYVMTMQGMCAKRISNCVIYNNKLCIECEPDYFNVDGKCEKVKSPVCKIATNLGCLSCEDSFYSDKNLRCQACASTCERCITRSNICYSCSSEMYLSNEQCSSNIELDTKCVWYTPQGKCPECNDGYFLKELECFPCDESCYTCVNTNTQCITCGYNYFRNGSVCSPKSGIEGCAVEVTENGCSECDSHYYKYMSECKKCPDMCETCNSDRKCTGCKRDEILLSNATCVKMKSIHCVKVTHSKCIECEKIYKLGFNGESCQERNTNLFWVVFSIFVFVLLIIATTMCVYFSLKRIQTNSLRKKLGIFPLKVKDEEFMKQFEKLSVGIVVTKKVLKFDHEDNAKDEQGLIPICTKSVETFKIGNVMNKAVKFQVITTENNEKTDIEITPNIFFLRANEGCVVSVSLTPICTCHIVQSISIVSLIMKDHNEQIDTIQVDAQTELSTSIDPDELQIVEKIGEGSFGIVYKGKFKNNTVAIKKLRTIDDDALDEFKTEVKMLDKFRCDYTIYFYGAVMIRNKICMVTELAQYGSLRDLMEKSMVLVHPTPKMKIKFMLDLARGVEYLHNNSILHRDIKPDNLLITSLEENVKVNAKITDFGSSRNVNAILINSTFTKGVGTPKFMAPEVLDRKHYEKPADIFSVGMTLYETFKWGYAYDPEKIKSWDIADNVCKGLRPDLDEIDERTRNITSRCWEHHFERRAKIKEVVEELTQLYGSLK